VVTATKIFLQGLLTLFFGIVLYLMVQLLHRNQAHAIFTVGSFESYRFTASVLHLNPLSKSNKMKCVGYRYFCSLHELGKGISFSNV